MVFIHGGAYVSGFSYIYNMSTFVINHDVIGVTINYRLGILGFLSMENEASPGNYGLWDQSLALRWIKDNIRAFGGDPDDITISGESAGGSSVGYQSITPVNKGLFSKASPQSGTASSVFGEAINPQKHSLSFAKGAGCWDGEVTGDKIGLEESQKVVDCLRKAEVSKFTSFPFSIGEPLFVPTVDGDFLPRRPIHLLQDEVYLKSIGFFDRSYLVTVNNNEFAILDMFFHMTIRMLNQDNSTTDEEKKNTIQIMKTKIRDAYLNSRLDTQTPDNKIIDDIMNFYDRRRPGHEPLLDMVTDLSFLVPSYDFVKAASKDKSCKSWLLYFNYFPNYMKDSVRGSPHAIDLLYWHDIELQMLEMVLQMGLTGQMDDGDFKLKQMFSSVIADFMKNG